MWVLLCVFRLENVLRVRTLGDNTRAHWVPLTSNRIIKLIISYKLSVNNIY